MKRITLIYLASYLMIGGIGCGFFPAIVLELFMSTGNYGDIMPRMVGMFMIVLGLLIMMFVINRDYKYYLPTIIARTFIVIFMIYLYFATNDILFVILLIVVSLGLLPSVFVFLKDRSSAAE